MTPSAIYSKSGKGVQEATGKTSILSRSDRAVLGAFDGKLTVGEVAERVGKSFDAKFQAMVVQLEKDGFIRQVSAGTVPPVRPAGNKPAAPAAKPASAGAPGEDLDFTIISSPKPKPAAPAAPPVDLAAKARADAERKAKEEEATSYKARQEAEARAKAEAEARAKAAAQERAQAEAEARAKAEAEARARAEAEAKARAAEAERALADADAKIKAAQEAAQRIAREAKARAEAEAAAKVQAELTKAREEAERKAREDAERIRREAEEKARREAEEKARREQEELRKKLEEERKAREEAERRAREAEERRRKEEEERRAREEAERKAREEAERRAKEEAERKAREEAERKAREEAERRAREEAERQAREAEERRRKEEEERRRREEEERRRKEEEARRAREEEERRAAREREERERRERAEADARRAREDEERRAREEADRRAREEESERKAKEEAERRARDEAERRDKEREAPAAGKGGDFADSLLADLDSFDKREEEERKAKEEAESRRKAEKERKAREKAERRARDEAEQRAQEERERREKQEAERRAREEEEREAEEAAERERRDAEARKRKAKETLAARAPDGAAGKAAEADDDIGITDEDLDLDEVKRDEAALSKQARRAAREREREKERPPRPASDVPPAKFRRPMKWGKPVAMGLFLLLVAGIGVIHVMPVSTAEYESAASEALGTPVKIGSARLSLLTGVELKMSNVAVGAAKIAAVRARPEIGSLFNPRKSFSSIELEDASVPQEALGAVLYGKARGANFDVRRVTAQKLRLTGPVVLPPLDADLQLGAEGEARSLTLKGPDGLLARVAPAAGGDLEFELNATTFTVPVAPDIVLNGFGMKGTANRQGMDVASWTASLYEGVISGTARVAWREGWSVDGVVTARGVNAAVFAPALLSEGRADGTGKFSMSGVDPAKLAAGGRLEGTFTVNKGALGSIDISRALSTGGRQAAGRTPFSELSGQGVYDRGAVSLRNITLTAGALNAGASADIAASGTLSGRIVADVKTANQTLRATLSVGGTVKEPQVRN